MTGNIGKGVLGSSKKGLLFVLIRDHSPHVCAKYVGHPVFQGAPEACACAEGRYWKAGGRGSGCQTTTLRDQFHSLSLSLSLSTLSA